jgi:hypothetical protein
MVRQDTPPDGRVRALALDIPLNWVPDGWLRTSEALDLMQDRLRRLAAWTEARRSASTGGEDRALLGEVHGGLEAQLDALSHDAVRSLMRSDATKRTGALLDHGAEPVSAPQNPFVSGEGVIAMSQARRRPPIWGRG